MDEKKLQMRKIRKGFFLFSCVMAVVLTVNFVGKQIRESLRDANAANHEMTLQDYAEKYLGNGQKSLKNIVEPKPIVTERKLGGLKGATTETLPARYNSREEDCGGANGCVSRLEDQMSEGLCWAYSYTTVAESYLLKTAGVKVELSPKQMDYLMVPGSVAYFDSTTNPYYDFVQSIATLNRGLGDGGNNLLSGYIGASKIGLVGDAAFWAKMQANDSALSGFPSYTDFLESREEGFFYAGKQHVSDVLNEDNSEYEVLASEDITFLGYGEDDGGLPEYTRTEAIRDIKDAILKYGAVEDDSYFDPENCMYYTADPSKADDDGMVLIKDLDDITVIDRGYGVCTEAAGHALTLVGWDDDWEYIDNDVTKKGAFIVQNSWGEEMDAVPTYLSYDSDLDMHFISEVRSVASKPANSHVYDMTDYKTNTVTPSSSELIYTFQAESEQEVIDDIGFYQVMYYGDVDYDVFVSPTGNGADFAKVGTINTPYPGHYVLHLNQTVEDNFAVKIVERSYPAEAGGFSADERNFDTVTVWTHEVVAPAPTAYDYVLSFDANGGSGAPGNITYSGTETSHNFTIPDSEPTYEGNHFLGWADNSAATVASYEAGDIVSLTFAAPTKILYAVWKENEPEPPLPTVYEYSLMFDANGGSGAPGTMTYSGVETSYGFVIPNRTMTREGYEFLGWADSRDATEIKYTAGSTVILNSSSPMKTIYAVWRKNTPIEPTIYVYTLAFNANGGEGGPDMLSYMSADSVYEILVPRDEPVREGYIFIGWASTNDSTIAEYAAGNVVRLSVSNPSKILYAVWVEDTPGVYTYVLSFNLNGGDGVQEMMSFTSTEMTYEVALPSTVPKRKGYKFVKWVDSLTDPSDTSYMPGSVITLYADSPVFTLYAVWEKDGTVEPEDPEDPEDPEGPEDPEDPWYDEPDVPDAGMNSKLGGIIEKEAGINVAVVIAGIAMGALGIFANRRGWRIRLFRR